MQRDSQLAPLFSPHQAASGAQAAPRSFRRNRFVHDEVCALTEDVADLFPSVHQGDDQRAPVHREFAHGGDQFQGCSLILAIKHDRVVVLPGQAVSGRSQVFAIFRFDAELFQDLAEHQHRFFFCTHHQ